MNIGTHQLRPWYINEFDKFQENWEVDLEQTYESYINFLIARDPEKYKDFSKSLQSTWLLTKLLWLKDRELRVELLKWTYLSMRVIDDICDKDILLELPDEERLSLVNIIYNWDYSQVPVLESALSRIWEISQQLGFHDEYSKWLQQIIQSMRYDLLRILDDTTHKRTRKDIEENFYKMDIHWTQWNSALLLWVNPEKTTSKTEFLWTASGKAYSLRDLHDDLWKNIINIPLEDIEKFDISDEDLRQVWRMKSLWDGEIPLWIKKWIKQEIDQANELLEMHDDIFNISNTIAHPPMEWWNRLFNAYGSTLMTQVFKKWYKDDIVKILETTNNTITWLAELWLKPVVPSKAFSLSWFLTKTLTYFYSLNSWDIEKDVKQETIQKSGKLCEKYKSDLMITDEENERYTSKSKNLSLMYLWFLDPENYTDEQLDWCVKAGFLSCAYDVCSDWWKWEWFDQKFDTILQGEVSEDLQSLAMDLFNKDVKNNLKDDWLDRWSVTMQFIWWCTGITNQDFIDMHWMWLDEMWRYLQMVDDIMDVEEDFDELEHNFLWNKATREKNLEDFISFFEKQYFHKQSLLQIWINLSIKKAKKILQFIQSN